MTKEGQGRSPSGSRSLPPHPLPPLRGRYTFACSIVAERGKKFWEVGGASLPPPPKKPPLPLQVYRGYEIGPAQGEGYGEGIRRSGV